MELSLPETFEAYSDARKAGFLKVKAAKEGGRRVAGTFCTFTPLEILDAAGMLAVSLCGMSAETIPAAEVPVYLLLRSDRRRNDVRREEKDV